MTEAEKYEDLKRRIYSEAEKNYGEFPYWMENELMAAEVSRDLESIERLTNEDKRADRNNQRCNSGTS